MLAVTPHEVQLLHVDQSWSEDVNLTPVQSHVYQNKFLQMRVNQLLHFFISKVVLINPFEFVARQNESIQKSKLSRDLVKLVPGIKHVLVKVEILRARDHIINGTFWTKIRDFHVF